MSLLVLLHSVVVVISEISIQFYVAFADRAVHVFLQLINGYRCICLCNSFHRTIFFFFRLFFRRQNASFQNRTMERKIKSALALKSYRDEFSCFKRLQRSIHTLQTTKWKMKKNHVQRKETKHKTKHKKKSKHNKTIGQCRERERERDSARQEKKEKTNLFGKNTNRLQK